jgi:hypothetical protein
MNNLSDLGAAVHQFRANTYYQQFNANPQSLIRTVKKVKEINLTLFFRKFATYHALAQLIELKDSRHLYFSGSQLMCILEESEAHKEDSYGLERALVRHYNCDRSRPICLFDFTLKTLVLDF